MVIHFCGKRTASWNWYISAGVTVFLDASRDCDGPTGRPELLFFPGMTCRFDTF